MLQGVSIFRNEAWCFHSGHLSPLCCRRWRVKFAVEGRGKALVEEATISSSSLADLQHLISRRFDQNDRLDWLLDRMLVVVD